MATIEAIGFFQSAVPRVLSALLCSSTFLSTDILGGERDRGRDLERDLSGEVIREACAPGDADCRGHG